jgi:methylmalonyl-CoA mutase
MIPDQDYQFLFDAGVSGVFGLWTLMSVSAQKIFGDLMA